MVESVTSKRMRVDIAVLDASFSRRFLITDGLIYNFKGNACSIAALGLYYVHCFMHSF